MNNISVNDRSYLKRISGWRGCCHHCHRAPSVAGKINNDGLCDFCLKKGRIATW